MLLIMFLQAKSLFILNVQVSLAVSTHNSIGGILLSNKWTETFQWSMPQSMESDAQLCALITRMDPPV